MVVLDVRFAERAERLPTPEVARLHAERQRVGACDRADWGRATTIRDPVTVLKQRRRVHVNRATFKLHEMLGRMSHPVFARVALLCEAPGGFLFCARQAWPCATLRATSLERAIEWASPDDPAIVRGLPHDADLLRREVEDAVVRAIGPADFVTADGGHDVADLDAQEQASVPIALAQLATALRLQAPGGTLVLKVFEGSTLVVRQIFEVLRGLYRTVMLCKPHCSKACNSERYVIARDLVRDGRDVAKALRAALERGLVIADLGVPVSEPVHRAFDSMLAEQAAEIARVLGCIQKRNMEPLRQLARAEADRLVLR